MGGVAFITGAKYVNGKDTDCFYIGSVQNDGYIYFNDGTMYRMPRGTTDLQSFYVNKQIWVNSGEIYNLKVFDFSPEGIVDSIGGITAGNGAISPNDKVEAAVQWMINKATNNYVTYSQQVRNLKNPNGSSYDCSSFVITGFYVGGYDANAWTTVQMKDAFTALGFTWYPGSYFTSDQLQRGDILLNIIEHTQVYIGNNQDVVCGDTPARVTTHSPDNYGSGWDGVLRAPTQA